MTRNVGTLAIAGAFTAIATGCTGLVAGGVATTRQAVLTMSDGNTYTSTTNRGVGPMVGGVIPLGSGISFPEVRFPSGTYASVAGAGLLPVYPTSLCFTVDLPIEFSGGTVNQCTQEVCFRPSFANANLGLVSRLTGGGTVVFGTVWQGALGS